MICENIKHPQLSDFEQYCSANLRELVKLDFKPNFEEIYKYNKYFLLNKQKQIDAVLTEHYFKFGIIFYAYGDRTRDSDKIIKWLKLAAKKGHSLAQLNLGACYYKGDCVKKDIKEAIKWVKLSAKQGNADAQIYLTQIQNQK